MRRSAALLAALVAATGIAVVPGADAGPKATWAAEPTMIAGTGRYDRGVYVYNDFVFDDYGANTGSWSQPNVVSLAGTSGDARYPDGEAFRDNAADIAEVRVRVAPANSADLEVRVRLQTLVDPDVVALWTRAGEAESVVTVKTPGAVFDTTNNTVTFRLPGAASAASTRLNIGAGLHDGKGGLRPGVEGNASMSPDEYTTGGPTDNRLFDLAFNTREIEPRGGAWNEDAQSSALASGKLSGFAHQIDVTALRDRRRTTYALKPGYYVRLFESRQAIDEGMHEDFPQYGGKLQPYALWIPTGYRADRPSKLMFNLHSLSVHHNQYRGGTSSTYTTFYEQMGDVLNAIVVTPLGRGPDGWYLDEAFVDTLEVWADARRTFDIDDDATVISGYSMGGYGTYRFTTLMPDSFASAASVVGPPTSGIWTGTGTGYESPYLTHGQLENTRNIPFWITHGAADELVPVYGVTRQANRLGELGHEYRYALHPAEDHLTFSVKDEWSREARWLASHPLRAVSPSEVTLRVRPASLLSKDKQHLAPLVISLLEEIGAQVDGAYWVGDVVVARQGLADVTGVVYLSSGGIQSQRAGTTKVTTAGTDGPSPYALTGMRVSFADTAPADVLRGHLADVASLTVDVGRAGLSNSPRLEITTNREVRISFVRNGRRVGSAVVAPSA